MLVVGSPADDAAVRRVAAELEAIGLEVHIDIVVEPQPLTHPALEDDGGRWRAIVWVDAARGEVQLLVRGRAGRTTAHIAEEGPGGRPPSDVVLAHRTVEILRAGLRERSSADRPALAAIEDSRPSPRAAPEPEPPQARARYETLFVLLGGGITGSPGRLAPFGHGAIGVRWQAHPRVAVALRGLVPLHGRQVRRPEGRATVWLGTTEPWLWIGLGRPQWRWQPDVGVGTGIVVLGSRGDAAPPLQSSSEVAVAAIVSGGAGLSVWLHPRVRLRVDGFVGVALPRPGVRFAGREVAHWGRPWGGGTLGVEVGVL